MSDAEPGTAVEARPGDDARTWLGPPSLRTRVMWSVTLMPPSSPPAGT